MEEGKRYVRLGAFVMVTGCVLVAVLFLLGGRKLFQPTFTFETYFDESVAGLDLGAPVSFRGVPLGHVTEILTSAATYEADVPLIRRRQYIVVRAEVDFSAEEAEQLKQDVVQMVKRGLRAQTQLAGITGQQYLAIDYIDPAKYPLLEFEWTPKYTYVPSAPSAAGEIIANAQTFMASLNEADIRTLARNLNTLVADLVSKLNEVPVAELSANANDVLTSANAAFERIDRILAAAPIDQTLRKLDSAATRIDALLADDGDVDRMITHIDETAQRLDALIGDNQYDVRVIVQDLHVTADNLRELSETVKHYPAGALVAGPPDKVRLPETPSGTPP
jgi:phospholipid/cholesterol/gamma-HCH transport system substrate-binding protein/paraquat-inducible protein B